MSETPTIQGELIDDINAVSENALATLTRSEIDVQISTAHRYPRSPSESVKEAESMATRTIETAASCFYKLPRGNGIEGPSVRLAEIFASAWGNLRIAARIIEETDEYIVAQGVAHDLQTNVARSTEVRRRITDKHGRRYSSDMIIVTANAACAIASRNALFQVIPRAYVDQVYLKAKQVAIGNAKTLDERRGNLIQYINLKLGITSDRIMNVCNKSKIEDIDLNDLETLHGLCTSIKDGIIDIDKAFPKPESSDEKPKSKLEEMTGKIGGETKKKETESANGKSE